METDKELTEFIKQTLDGYEEEYIPGAWENFVNKQKKRKRIIIWRLGSGIAATIMFGWLGFYFYHSSHEKNKALNHKQIVNTEKPKAEKSPVSKEKGSTFAPKNMSSVQNSELNKGILNSGSSNTRVFRNDNISTDSVNVSEFYSVSTFDDPRDTSVMQTRPSVKVIDMQELATEADKMDDSIKNRFVAESVNIQLEEENNENEKATKRKIRFGINLSPGFNSTQTASALNFSGGINTNITIFNNLELSTGLQLEHQSVLNNPTQKDNTDASADKSRANLVNLDLPINVTWKFYSNDSKSYYISGGVSSLAYLSEKYKNTSYTQELREIVTLEGGQEKITYELVNIESTTKKSVSSFHSFDLAGRVNIIFGLEQHLSEKLFLHVEPFIKIPISGLASENLKFTTSGITCKISF